MTLDLDRVGLDGGPAARLVDRISRRLGGVSRRGFLSNVAVVGSAVAVSPKTYLLQPGTAYDSVCGPSSTAEGGYTVFCCTVNNGVNACPPGSFTAGWWKAAGSSWCCGGYRYIVDCNASCSRCSSGCSGDHICDSGCWNCSCGRGSSATCDQRRYCCNAFRYGQCNTHVSCSGGVVCRVVSCVPPYQWDNCSTTSLSDNSTTEHSAPCEQGCSAILTRYNALGANGSELRASTGPERSVSDGRGRYVTYQNGRISWTSTTGAYSVSGATYTKYAERGLERGELGYPKAERVHRSDGSWYQIFENGMILDSRSTYTTSVSGATYTKYVERGRETGEMGYPTAERVHRDDGSWYQTFQNGMILDSRSTYTTSVSGVTYTKYVERGRETGEMGYPTAERVHRADGSWYQTFQNGIILDSRETYTTSVSGVTYTKYVDHGRETGVLGYPTGERVHGTGQWYQTFQNGTICDSSQTVTSAVLGPIWTRWVRLGAQSGPVGFPRADARGGRDGRGAGQVFVGGELWALRSSPVYLLTGRVLERWLDSDAEVGRWGYPLSDVTETSDGTQRATFEGGVLSVSP